MALPSVLQAVRSGEIAPVAELLQQGYDPNMPVGDDGEMLLSWAASYGHLPIVELLIAHDVDVNARPPHGLSLAPINDAIAEGHLDVAHALADAGAEYGFAQAAALGKLDWLRSYTESHEQLWAAFLAACKTGQLEIVQYLVPRGIDLTQFPSGGEYSGIGASGLHYAASNNHLLLVEWLVKAGTPVDIRDDTFEDTPLDWAMLHNHRLCAELLVELGAA